MSEISIVVLAAGLGKRMGGVRPKVLTETEEGTLISLVLKTALGLHPKEVSVVTGFGREEVEAHVRAVIPAEAPITFAHQSEQRGTGHATQIGASALKQKKGSVLILYGDVPLISEETLRTFISFHESEKSEVSLISELVTRDTSYGRVLRDANTNEVMAIREKKDCSFHERMVTEVNSGVYLVEINFLKESLQQLTPHNAQGEYYLTDVVAIAVAQGKRVSAFRRFEDGEVFGVNDFSDLSMVNQVLRQRRCDYWLKRGVLIADPTSTFIGKDVTLSPGASIGPNTILRGTTEVKAGVVIEGTAFISDSIIDEQAHLKFSVRVDGAIIGKGASVGPFAHIRPKSVLDADVKIGNFVETKAAHLEVGAKASHLSYLGDCHVGKNANIGAGTITCNYDGYKKYKTEIGDHAFIGSNTSLVAPVTIGAGAIIGAGSAITKDVPADALALTRAEQTIKPGWAKKFNEQKKG